MFPTLLRLLRIAKFLGVGVGMAELRLGAAELGGGPDESSPGVHQLVFGGVVEPFAGFPVHLLVGPVLEHPLHRGP